MRTKRALQQNLTFRCLLFTFCMLVFSGGLYAAGEEEYQKKKITVQANQETVEQVLNKIGKAADVRFFYNHSAFDFSKKISIDAKEQELRNVVNQVLAEYPVDVEYQLNHTIVLRQKTQNIASVEVQKVSGRVTDAKNGEALIGASIVLKESPGIGVVTDIDGNFHLELAQGSATALIVSFIGYQTEEIKLSGSGDVENVTVKLTPMATELEDVVVTGMAPRKSESFTGSYVSVKGDELKRLSPNNLLQALQFFDPSFRIVENNAQGSNPNAMPEFQVRGNAQIGSFSNSEMNMLVGNYSNQPNMPLFILDGFEATLQKIVDLDPERVESITILKDASATAIYGSRAANGVVVFETKKPLPGALNITYSTNIGITVPDLSDYNLMNAEEKLQFEYDAGLFTHDADGKPLSGAGLATQMNYYNKYRREIQRGVNTYWLSEPLRTAVIHRHTLSIDGGDEAFRYNVSLNYGNSPGVMKESDRRTLGLGLNMQYRRKKWNVNNRLTVDNSLGHNTPYGSFSDYTRLNQYYTKTDENGNITKVIEEKPLGPGLQKVQVTNPLYNTQFPFKSLSENFTVTDNLAIEFSLFENLRFNAEASLTKGTSRSEDFRSMNHTMFANEEDLTKKGSYSKNLGNSFSWSTNASVNYNLTKDKHLVSMFARWEIAQNRSDATFFSAKGFPNDNMTDFLFAYEMDNRVNGNENTTRSLGVTGQVSYMYDYRYSMDFSIRGDMSSQFGADTRMKPFWAVGLRWNASREKWLENTVVSNLVIRGSYGITGSQNYDPYQAIESYSFENMMFPYLSSGVLGAELQGFGNSDLDWSTTKDLSAALEFGFWNNRFTGSVNYYNHYTDELLLDYNIAPSAGFPTMMTNIGSIANQGVDAMLGVVPVQDFERQLQWSINVNASHNRNKVKKISNQIKNMNQENLENKYAPVPIYEEGKSTSQLFVVQSLGIDPTTGKEVFLKRNGEKTFTWDPVDKIAVGDTEPKLRGSITSSLVWKDWSVALGFTYQLGAYAYNQTLVNKIENIDIARNVDRRAAENRWRKPGDVAKYKSISYTAHTTELSSRFVQKVNEIVFSSVNVGYHFDPKNYKFLRQCHISGLNVNATMQDLGRLSTVKQERGTEYPFARTFNLSLSVLFN